MPGTMLSRGNILYSFVIAPSLTPALVSSATSAEQTFTIAGLQTNDFVTDFAYAGGAFTTNVSVGNFRVSAANTLKVTYQNNSGGDLTPPAGVYLIGINRLEVSKYSELPTTAV